MVFSMMILGFTIQMGTFGRQKLTPNPPYQQTESQNNQYTNTLRNSPTYAHTHKQYPTNRSQTSIAKASTLNSPYDKPAALNKHLCQSGENA